MKHMAACLLLAVAVFGGGCSTTQQLAGTTITGRVVDRHTGAPVADATIRFVYNGPTRDFGKGPDGSLSLDPIEAGSVRTDADGRFTARIEARKVKRPLIDPWDPFPDIHVTKDGYHAWHAGDLNLWTRYREEHGVNPQTPWPFFEPFVIRLARVTPATTNGSSAQK
jgi:hypothetical protein